MAEAATDESLLLCKHIVRISGGQSSVKFGELMQDEEVEQIFEALMGTLKAARKRDLLSFEGELLLQGQHDDHVITLSDAGVNAAVPALDSEEPAPAATEVEDGPAPVPAAEVPADTPDADEASPAAAEQAADPAPEEAEKRTPSSQAPKEKEGAGFAGVATTATKKTDNGKWEVDMKYIDHRTADPNNLEARRGNDLQGDAGVGSATTKKDEDGKWKVDMGYIDHRTADPNNLEARKAGDAQFESVGTTATKKDEDGKWKVDMGYINHRTGVVDNLDGRKNNAPGMPAGPLSMTTKKSEDGKWKVDMGYIGHRTADTSNLERNVEVKDTPTYADPASKKYTYEEVKAKPADVDPAKKEAYLSDAEFQTVMGVSPAEYSKMPKWKQQNLKKAKDLF